MKRTLTQPIRRLACAGLLLAGTAAGLAAQQAEAYGTLSPATARTLSGAATVTPIALAVLGGHPLRYAPLTAGAAGLALGPALGYVYAGESGRGLKRAAVRAAIVGLTIAGTRRLCAPGGCDARIIGSGDDSRLFPAALLVTTGVVTTAVLAVRDISRVGRVVETRNQRRAAVALRPVLVPERRGAGLVVSWRR